MATSNILREDNKGVDFGDALWVGSSKEKVTCAALYITCRMPGALDHN